MVERDAGDVYRALAPGQAFYIPTGHTARLGSDGHLPLTDALTRLGPLIEDPGIKITGHNLKADVVTLANHGVRMHGLAFDTMLAAFLAAMVVLVAGAFWTRSRLARQAAAEALAAAEEADGEEAADW